MEENRDEMKVAVVEAMVEAMAEWLPVDATTDDVVHIVGAFAVEMSVRSAHSADQAVDMVSRLSVELATVVAAHAHDVRDIFEQVAAENEGESFALPESEDR